MNMSLESKQNEQKNGTKNYEQNAGASVDKCKQAMTR